ncbi:Uncharacterized protein Adt_31400 [Abeliophyllum distichum]|uniref:Uncharacterized protein n=1 Tax=Abeliophyllum distichum TaxID=126358 RepID=A0ABD1RF18_9LAMI
MGDPLSTHPNMPELPPKPPGLITNVVSHVLPSNPIPIVGLTPPQSGSIGPQNLQPAAALGGNPSTTTNSSHFYTGEPPSFTSTVLGDPNHASEIELKAQNACYTLFHRLQHTPGAS